MVMNNLADLVVGNINVDPINQAINQRFSALSGEMNTAAAEEFLAEAKDIACFVDSDGNDTIYTVTKKDTYLLQYLKDPKVPLLGGVNGKAHNPDGTTYDSQVPVRLHGTPVPEIQLPKTEAQIEAEHITEIMAPDATQDGVNHSMSILQDNIAGPLVDEYMNGGD